jgi:hypothetical protein
MVVRIDETGREHQARRVDLTRVARNAHSITRAHGDDLVSFNDDDGILEWHPARPVDQSRTQEHD